MTGKKQLATRAVHPAGEERQAAAVAPIHRSTVWRVETSGADAEIDGAYQDLIYPRYSNQPALLGLGRQLADLEGAEAGLLFSSGMAAISSALTAVLRSGDHVLAQEGVYGGTHGLLAQRFPTLGIDHDFVDSTDASSWAARLRPTTRVFYVETLGNPLLRVPDLEAVVTFARQHELVTIIDNTFASPANFRPAELGFDMSVHSCTKYLNGHSDVLAGALLGRQDLVQQAAAEQKLFGGALDPQAAFLLARGVRTLALRIDCHNHNAVRLAEHLEKHEAVASVTYPGLDSHPDHRRASELLDGFGGMLTMELHGGWPAARRFLDGVQLATHGPSLGGVETLVVSPAKSSHAAMPADERRRIGIGDGMIRISVGIEAVEDLIADFDQALASAQS